jgi:tetratricopeptide (TPR) repeat protein
MNESQLISAYLDLFQKGRADPSLVADLQSLRTQAEQAALPRWTRIIEARIAQAEARYEDVLRIIDPVISEDSGNPHAVFMKGSVLRWMPGRQAEGLGLLDLLIARLGSATDGVSERVLIMAMVNKGAALGEMGRHPEGLATCEAVIERFGNAAELPLRDGLARAMVNRGMVLGRMGKDIEALAACEAVIERFGNAAELPLREQVAMAMVNKGVALARMGRHPEALAACEALIERLGTPAELPLCGQLAMAMVNKGVVLRQMGRHPDALAAFQAVLERFGGRAEPELVSSCDHAQRLKAVLLAPKGGPAAEEAKETAITATEGKYSKNLRVYLELALAHFERPTLDGYLKRIKDSENDTKEFLSTASLFAANSSFLLILREWNSYTPALPAEGESDRGGGYFIRHAGAGIVVDPGYDFIENFYRAGGRLCDIDHICITHAHDDHTAELESLLMLLHRYNRESKGDSQPPKRVSVYMSEACHRKFAGLIPLRDDSRFHRVVTLTHPWEGCLQVIRLTDKITLTVLPAYHDDVVTRDTAVGLDFRFALDYGQSRRVLFTGDTGYYPRLTEADGREAYYDEQKRRPKVDAAEGKGIEIQYAKGDNPEETEPPDLLVAHIGSIQEQEFVSLDAPPLAERDEGEWYYANHLGMLGTLTLLDRLAPRSAIISEFGAEMKGFHIDLVNTIAKALRDKQSRKPGGPQTAVFPGDLTMVYYIAEDKFLCHEDSKPHAAAELTCQSLAEWRVKSVEGDVPDVNRNTAQKRAHLCLSKMTQRPNEWGIRDYYQNRFLRNLPHFKKADGTTPSVPEQAMAGG